MLPRSFKKFSPQIKKATSKAKEEAKKRKDEFLKSQLVTKDIPRIKKTASKTGKIITADTSKGSIKPFLKGAKWVYEKQKPGKFEKMDIPFLPDIPVSKDKVLQRYRDDKKTRKSKVKFSKTMSIPKLKDMAELSIRKAMIGYKDQGKKLRKKLYKTTIEQSKTLNKLAPPVMMFGSLAIDFASGGKNPVKSINKVKQGIRILNNPGNVKKSEALTTVDNKFVAVNKNLIKNDEGFRTIPRPAPIPTQYPMPTIPIKIVDRSSPRLFSKGLRMPETETGFGGRGFYQIGWKRYVDESMIPKKLGGKTNQELFHPLGLNDFFNKREIDSKPEVREFMIPDIKKIPEVAKTKPGKIEFEEEDVDRFKIRRKMPERTPGKPKQPKRTFDPAEEETPWINPGRPPKETPTPGETPGKTPKEIPTPGKTDPGKTDKTKTDPAKTDPAKTDPAKTDPGKGDPGKGDPVKDKIRQAKKTDTKGRAIKLPDEEKKAIKVIELKGSRFPKTLQWRQGRVYKKINLQTGKIRNSLKVLPGGVKSGITPRETLKINSWDDIMPKTRRFDMGVTKVKVSSKKIKFFRR